MVVVVATVALGSETVLAFAEIAVAILALGRSVTVLFACKHVLSNSKLKHL